MIWENGVETCKLSYVKSIASPGLMNNTGCSVEIFENVAYIMAFHADPSIPGTIDEWLEQFEMFSIYEILPEILDLWGTNLITDVQSKKNSKRAAVK